MDAASPRKEGTFVQKLHGGARILAQKAAFGTLFCCVIRKHFLEPLVCSASVVGCNHKGDLLLLVDFIEEAPRPNSIPPRLRMKSLEFFNVQPEMGMFRKLGVHKRLQFSGNSMLT
jgi:hypothetical protein